MDIELARSLTQLQPMIDGWLRSPQGMLLNGGFDEPSGEPVEAPERGLDPLLGEMLTATLQSAQRSSQAVKTLESLHATQTQGAGTQLAQLRQVVDTLSQNQSILVHLVSAQLQQMAELAQAVRGDSRSMEEKTGALGSSIEPLVAGISESQSQLTKTLRDHTKLVKQVLESITAQNDVITGMAEAIKMSSKTSVSAMTEVMSSALRESVVSRDTTIEQGKALVEAVRAERSVLLQAIRDSKPAPSVQLRVNRDGDGLITTIDIVR